MSDDHRPRDIMLQQRPDVAMPRRGAAILAGAFADERATGPARPGTASPAATQT